jgi:hypothetical protein
LWIRITPRAEMVGRNFLIALPIDPCELMETRHLERDSFVLFDIFGEGVLRKFQGGLVGPLRDVG